MADALIYDFLRTPRGSGRATGGLHTLSPIDLGATVLRALDERTGCNRTDIDDVVFGCGDAVDDQGADIARSSLLRAGFDERISGSVVSRFCSSGLDATNAAAARVMAGQADCMIAGGVEMMSLISMGGTGGPWGSDAEFNTITNFTPLGVAADLRRDARRPHAARMSMRTPWNCRSVRRAPGTRGAFRAPSFR